MATQAVIKPQHQIDSEKRVFEIFHITRTDSVGLDSIAFSIQNHPESSTFSANDLDEIIAGKFLECSPGRAWRRGLSKLSTDAY